MEKPELKGIELEDPKISFKNGQAVLTGSVVHVGKIGHIKLTLDAAVDATPVVDEVLDLVEKAIPGDQKKLFEETIKPYVHLALGKV